MTLYTGPVEVTDVPSFIDGVTATLRYWRDLHTDAETWTVQFDDMLADTVSLDELGKGYFTNDYYSVSIEDVKRECAKMMYEGVQEGYCDECGEFNEGTDTCDECEGHVSMMDIDDIAGDINEVDYATLRRVIKFYVFPIYKEALEDVIEGVLEDIQAHLEDIESANEGYELLAATVKALSIAHIHGQIFEDYLGYGIWNMEWSDILNIRENGLTAHFTPDEVKEYLDAA